MKVVTPRLEAAITSVTYWSGMAIEMLDLAYNTLSERAGVNPAGSSTAAHGRELCAELLAALEEAQLKTPTYTTLEEAKAALRADPHYPRDVSDETLTSWAKMLVRP